MSGYLVFPPRTRLWWWKRRDQVLEALLFALTAAAIWAANAPEHRLLGSVLGLISAPLWVWFTARDGRWFLAAASVVCGAAWARGLAELIWS
ncbi:MAG: hypothetical protein C4525_03005 [Desulfarculus sp.]|nr:MAG: hypothetical protein C4525_03005 [Desulfarculus sp.]